MQQNKVELMGIFCKTETRNILEIQKVRNPNISFQLRAYKYTVGMFN